MFPKSGEWWAVVLPVGRIIVLIAEEGELEGKAATPITLPPDLTAAGLDLIYGAVNIHGEYTLAVGWDSSAEPETPWQHH